MNSIVSDETLHAFVDGELDVTESEALIARMREDQELAQRVCNLRSLQSMVRLAYIEPPVPDGRKSRDAPGRKLMQRFAVACLILAAGLSAGWVLRSNESNILAALPTAASSGFHAVSLMREADPNRVILHLDSDAPAKMLVALDQAEHLLNEAEQQGRAMQLEVISNSHGIDLLRAGVSPYAERIARLKRLHANLEWVACGQSVARFTKEGQTVVMLPSVRVAPTALGEIITRLQQGWTYVRV
jgi:intracellular sulfur oxidation DsrE/DsrF family protein